MRKNQLKNLSNKIAALENISVSDEDIESEYKNIAESYSIEVDQVKVSVAAESIAEDMKVKKAMDLVKEKAAIKTKEA